MSRYMEFIGITTIGLLLATAIFAPVEEARGDTIFTPVGGGVLGTVDTIDASPGSVVGPFNLLQPAPEDPALATIAISAAFNADGTELYTLINTLAPTIDNVSSQLGIIEDNGMITPVGDDVHPFNLVAMEIDSRDNILATGFNLPENPVLPGFNWFGNSILYNIDNVTGALTEIGETGIDVGPIMDLAINGKGEVWATTRNKLWTLNPKTGRSKFEVDISGIPDDGEGPLDAEIMAIYFDANDDLLGTDIKTGNLFAIDTETGSAEFLKATEWGFPFSPHGGDIFVSPVLPPGIVDNPGLDNPGLNGKLPPGLRGGLPPESHHHAVPEPTSAALLLLGYGICFLVRRR